MLIFRIDMYTILESKIEFQDNALSRVIVLVDCTSRSSKPYSDVRAIAATNKPSMGYFWIGGNHRLNMDLLQDVAAGGMELNDRDKLFPGWKSKLK